jgi:uncharacterized protein YyaL (SSP411 family)
MSESTGAPSTAAETRCITWEAWSAAAFERATEERKPVLLALSAFWCRGCDVMDRTSYRDPRVIDLVAAKFVPVKVDADRRPDINARYNLDGWPTTAVLTPDGEIMTGSTYLPTDALIAMLDEASTALTERYDELRARGAEIANARRASQGNARYEPDGEAPGWLLTRAFDEHDPVHGGFGSGGKFLHAGVLRFVLEMYQRTHDRRAADIVTRSLDAISRGGHSDIVDGGFFRYVAGRDFTRPHTEKLLEDQIAAIDLLLRAAVVFGRPEYRESAVDAIGYVTRSLSDPSRGGFFASQKADDEYYALSGSLRASLEAPAVDRSLFTDLNAQAIITWLDAAEALGHRQFAEFAVHTRSRVLAGTHRGEQGHAHWVGEDGTHDLLADQVHSARASVRLFEVTRDPRDLDQAAAAMQQVVRRFWDAGGSGFFDRAIDASDEIGKLADRIKPVSLNSLAAQVLMRIAALTGKSEWRVLARQALGAVTGTYRAHGLGAAPYALATFDVLASD